MHELCNRTGRSHGNGRRSGSRRVRGLGGLLRVRECCAPQIARARCREPTDQKGRRLRRHRPDAQSGAGGGDQSSRHRVVERPLENLSVKSKTMSAQFVPLLSPVPTSNESVSSMPSQNHPAVRRKICFQTADPNARRCHRKLLQADYYLGAKREVISGIRIQCKCGSVIELSCLH